MKNKKNLKIIVAIIITAIISCGITAFASIRFQANEIGYDTTTVADALDSLYQTQFSNNYSTTERVVGKWIDGKPLYQKTLEFTNITIGKTQSNIGSLSGLNIDYGNVIGVTTSENNQYYEGLGYFACWIRKTDSNLGIKSLVSDSNITYSKLWVTIQYTKTTDTASNNN